MYRHFFNIVKWKALLYLVFIQFLFKIFFLSGYGFNTRLSFSNLLLLSITTVTLLASGSLTNYFVRKKNTKKYTFSPLVARNLAVFLGVVAIVFSFLLAFCIEKPYYGFIGVVNLMIITIYSVYVVKKTIFTNIINSFIKAFSVLIVWWCDVPIKLTESQWDLFFKLQLITIFYISLSFIGSIIRDTVQDIVNINQDYIRKHQTIPILLGRKRTKAMLLMISIITSIIVLGFAISFVESKFILLTILFLGVFPELYFIYYLMIAASDKDYKLLFKRINMVYALGIISIPIIAYYFKYVIQ
ncbi:UbiA family prenyltransferase [Tenacibaculum sp. 190524A02b]|uniref:4-hydroxybenzoate polyprenyltransferase n=1 Tax=Tenacibaculum vairaonense TaxID=3137860 RepID=A0ABM9PNI6_9FLAO